MALHHELNNADLDEIVFSFDEKYFTTLKIVSILEKDYRHIFEKIKGYSPRNHKAIIGKAIKRYATETNKIKQASPPSESPARWEKS